MKYGVANCRQPGWRTAVVLQWGGNSVCSLSSAASTLPGQHNRRTDATDFTSESEQLNSKSVPPRGTLTFTRLLLVTIITLWRVFHKISFQFGSLPRVRHATTTSTKPQELREVRSVERALLDLGSARMEVRLLCPDLALTSE
jgi:hypothetical protein